MAALAGASLLAVPAANVLVDPYNVFGTGLLPPASTYNERFTKLDHLLRQPAAYDSLLLGSSRTGLLDPRIVAESWGQGSWHNLGLFAGTPRDALLMLTAFERGGGRLHRVALGLDPFMFIEPVSPEPSPELRHHPAVTGQAPLAFWSSYAFPSSSLPLISKLVHAAGTTPKIVFDPLSGRYTLPAWEQDIARDPSAHAARLALLTPVPRDIAWREQGFDDLFLLLVWLNSRHVERRVFLHPISPAERRAIASSSWTELRRRLHGLVPDMLDLSHLPGSDDLTLWYDTRHYRPPMALQVVRSLAPDHAPTPCLGDEGFCPIPVSAQP